jgi:hypothetical protein
MKDYGEAVKSYEKAKKKYINRMIKGMSSSDAYLLMIQETGDHQMAEEIFDDVLYEYNRQKEYGMGRKHKGISYDGTVFTGEF